MDYVTRQFINLAKKFRKELPKLANAIRGDFQKQVKAIEEAKNAFNESRNNPSILRAELHISHPIEVKTESKDKKRSREWYKLVIETLTFLSVLAYFLVTNRMYHEMISARHQTQHSVEAAERSANAAETANTNQMEHFRTEERPYVWIQNIGVADEKQQLIFSNRAIWTFVGTNEQPPINIGVNNFGHSPAVHLHSTKLEVILDKTSIARKKAKAWIPTYQKDVDNVLFPFMQGGLMFGTGYLPVIDIQLMADLRNKAKTAFVLGAVSYTDTSQPPIEPYETIFCYEVNGDGVPFSPCDAEIGQNRVK
jgi:hypothetical protein